MVGRQINGDVLFSARIEVCVGCTAGEGSTTPWASLENEEEVYQEKSV